MNLLDRIHANEKKTRVGAKVPRGFLTREQWGKKWGLRASQTRQLLRTGVEQGLIKIKYFRLVNDAGLYYCPPHYREVKR